LALRLQRADYIRRAIAMCRVENAIRAVLDFTEL
jgi:hypothetical protein